jgi:lipoprotein NlpD
MAACASPRAPAPITERTSVPSPVVSKPAEPARPSAPVVKTPREADARGFYTVKRGDTLIHISLEFGQNYRDIISWNNLANPNDIKVDQVLRVLPPEGSTVAAGVQTVPVPTGAATESRPLGSAANSANTSSAGAMKTTPHGEKRPYSEAALAELQKADTLAPAPVAKAETPQKPLDRAPENGEDEAVSWMWPTQGKILGPFDEAKRGIDIAGNSGQDVLAAADGKVSYATSIRGYGNLVIIKHTNNLLSAYAHNKTILVKENQTVTKGQKIAEMGNTDSDAVKLHFEIRQQGKPVDPAKFLPGR